MRSTQISILDVGIGNINSVAKALSYLNIEYEIISSNEQLDDARRIIFPGVGSFDVAVSKLKKLEMFGLLKEKILSGVPYLGICLGMQLLASRGTEGIGASGLEIISGEVNRIQIPSNERLPHIGWNSVSISDSCLFNGIEDNSDFYFVHSYCMLPKDADQAFYTDYYGAVCAYVKKGNAFGVQFHPEKSQKVGLRLLENFYNYSEEC